MSQPSGAAWVEQFQTSKSVADLLPDFAAGVNAFLATLRAAGATVTINATYRPPERAYLMHWCCMIASGHDPETVPPMAGVDIDWTHGGDTAAARAGAEAMANAYDISYPAALVSRHTQRRAIDMTIGWFERLVLKDNDGKSWSLDVAPRNGANPSLWAIGKTFGVIKLPSDPPHWSDDGH